MIYDIAIQAGHAGRTRGATGTAGPYGAEKVWTERTARALIDRLAALGWSATWTLADAAVPDSRLFFALHQDGSVNKAARGPSVGYPTGSTASRDAAQAWKAEYARHYPGPSFRRDNYTPNLAHYYGLNPRSRRGSSAPCRMICEHGFATNAIDAAWMWSPAGLDAVTAAVNAAAWHHLGPGIAQYAADLAAEAGAAAKSATGQEQAPSAPAAGPGPEPSPAVAKAAGLSETPGPAADPPTAPTVPPPADPPATVLPMTDAAARSAWTALQAAVPLLAHHQFIGPENAEPWHYLGITAIAAVLSAVKSLAAGRAH